MEYTNKDWFFIGLSEAALYAFFYYTLSVLGAAGNIWIHSLVLLVLINLSLFLCPVVKKHYL